MTKLAASILFFIFTLISPPAQQQYNTKVIDVTMNSSIVITDTISENLFFERLDTDRNRQTIESNLLRLNQKEVSVNLQFVAIANDVGGIISIWSSDEDFAKVFSPEVVASLGNSYPLQLEDAKYFPHPTNEDIVIVSRILVKNGVIMGASFTGVMIDENMLKAPRLFFWN